jgi:hypothetical protein
MGWLGSGASCTPPATPDPEPSFVFCYAWHITIFQLVSYGTERRNDTVTAAVMTLASGDEAEQDHRKVPAVPASFSVS